MTDPRDFEIPEAMRDMAQKNVEQMRAAYSQFMDAAQKAQDLVARSTDAMAAGAREVQVRAMQFTEQNVQNNFAFATELSRARDLKEAMEIQARFAQQQMQLYAAQAQELGRLMTEAAQRAQTR